MSFIVVCMPKKGKAKIISNPINNAMPPDHVYCQRCKRTIQNLRIINKFGKRGNRSDLSFPSSRHFIINSKSRAYSQIKDRLAETSPVVKVLSNAKPLTLNSAERLDSFFKKHVTVQDHKPTFCDEKFCKLKEECEFKRVHRHHGKNQLRHALQFCLYDGLCNQQIDVPKKVETIYIQIRK